MADQTHALISWNTTPFRLFSLSLSLSSDSFPGGKRDPTDVSTLATALRETEEEISIPPSDIEILGSYSAMPNKGCTMRVHPYVGIIRTPFDNFDDIAGLDSIFQVNQDEVSKVFAVPIEDLMDPTKQVLVPFRSSKMLYPVWKIDKEDITIWGLTAFILDGKGWRTKTKCDLYCCFARNLERRKGKKRKGKKRKEASQSVN